PVLVLVHAVAPAPGIAPVRVLARGSVIRHVLSGAGMVVHRHAGLAVLRPGYESLRRLCPWDATTQAEDAEPRSQVETPDGSLRPRVPRGTRADGAVGAHDGAAAAHGARRRRGPTPTWPGSYARVSVSRETPRDECAGRFSRWTSFTVAVDHREVHAVASRIVV